MKTYEAIPVTSNQMPSEAGWYNLITDAHPSAAGRAVFDGQGFVLDNAQGRLLRQGWTLFWLKEVNTKHEK